MERRKVLKAGLAAGVLKAAGKAQTAPPTPPPPQAKITSSVMLWTLKGSFEDKLETAAKAGLQSVELVSEHVNWSDAEIAGARKRARSFGLGIDTIIATPDWKKRPVSMVKPEQRDAFLGDVRQAITFAQKLEVPQIILMSGDEVSGRSREEQWASLLEGCKRAGDLAARAKVTMIVEPLNSKVNHKDFFLTTCVDGLQLIKQVDNPHVRLLFDLYHEQVQIGNVIRTAKEAAPYTAVYHVADNPGRNDPGTGELNYANIFKAIRDTGYAGYITMEYLPAGDQTESLIKAVDHMRQSLAS